MSHRRYSRVLPQEGHRMAARRQAGIPVVPDRLTASRHRPLRDRRLIEFRNGRILPFRGGKGRYILVAQPLDGPSPLAVRRPTSLR